MTTTFLEAEWRKLMMANYAVEPGLLSPYLPAGTELDFWNGVCYVSLVGFHFENTRLLGFSIPFHTHFEEVNLRFYVKHRSGSEWRRGVVFIKEIVPKTALTLIANTIYREHYETLPMDHSHVYGDDRMEVMYQWKKRTHHFMKIATDLRSKEIMENSEEEFITEHYWGYTKITDTKTYEYGVEHPRWQVYGTLNYQIEVDFAEVYGTEFSHLTHMAPKSVFLAEGSPIKVLNKRVL